MGRSCAERLVPTRLNKAVRKAGLCPVIRATSIVENGGRSDYVTLLKCCIQLVLDCGNVVCTVGSIGRVMHVG